MWDSLKVQLPRLVVSYIFCIFFLKKQSLDSQIVAFEMFRCLVLCVSKELWTKKDLRMSSWALGNTD